MYFKQTVFFSRPMTVKKKIRIHRELTGTARGPVPFPSIPEHLNVGHHSNNHTNYKTHDDYVVQRC